MMQSAPSPCSRVELLVARSLAACVHPVAAWRLDSRSVRIRILIGYLIAGYALALLGLFFAPSASSW
jgi:hypothetical protein